MNDLSDSPTIKNSSDDEFMADVVEASKAVPVIVDFWAPWCGPCKTLGPVLEDAVKKQDKKIKLVKIDIDKNPNIAAQLRVQSIPAVFAFSNGQPVDGFMGAQTAAQTNAFIEKIIDSHGPKDDGLNAAISTANEMLLNMDYSGAREIFNAIIAEDENLRDAHVGLIQSLLHQNDLANAKAAYDKIPDLIKTDQKIKTLFAQIQLTDQTSSAGNVEELRAKLIQSPENLDIQFELAIALIAEKQNREAIDILLGIIKKDVNWNDKKAKNQLIEFLDALGPESHEGRTGRRNLSSILFN